MFSFIMKHYLILIFRSSKPQNVFQDPQKIAIFPILKKKKCLISNLPPLIESMYCKCLLLYCMYFQIKSKEKSIINSNEIW